MATQCLHLYNKQIRIWVKMIEQELNISLTHVALPQKMQTTKLKIGYETEEMYCKIRMIYIYDILIYQ